MSFCTLGVLPTVPAFWQLSYELKCIAAQKYDSFQNKSQTLLWMYMVELF